MCVVSNTVGSGTLFTVMECAVGFVKLVIVFVLTIKCDTFARIKLSGAPRRHKSARLPIFVSAIQDTDSFKSDDRLVLELDPHYPTRLSKIYETTL